MKALEERYTGPTQDCVQYRWTMMTKCVCEAVSCREEEEKTR